MMTETASSIPPFADGILSSKQIAQAIDHGMIKLASPPADGQIQPASLDLRLGKRVWRVRASFLPGQGVTVAQKLDTIAMHEIDLTEGAVLEKGCVYVAELEESLNLPHNLARPNLKARRQGIQGLFMRKFRLEPFQSWRGVAHGCRKSGFVRVSHESMMRI
jgi:hypothetical protein